MMMLRWFYDGDNAVVVQFGDSKSLEVIMKNRGDDGVVLIVFTALSVGSGFLIHLLATGDGGFGNSGGDFGGSDGGGGGGGAGGGGFWSRLQSYLVANAKEDESQSKWGPHTIA
ncbi:hypothetical protein POM88_031250 [Heracleum sosnowskyi]|uniref:Uncharacterized protein n=1 Tax=Heracleum sosnowskyi TaxID=360622 RepID=A0AAD8HYZ6_9APIA|nr:hypothetical protein POM88_031250 [Heracleum sosnowskyi]